MRKIVKDSSAAEGEKWVRMENSEAHGVLSVQRDEDIRGNGEVSCETLHTGRGLPTLKYD